jgi:cyclic pyranopterin monophosphate synthase
MPDRRGRLSHVDARGRARMVDVGGKPLTRREALVEGRVRLSAEAFRLLRRNRIGKGDVLGVARIAAIQAAKRTADWIPLCHPVPLESIQVDFRLEPARRLVRIEARAATRWSTGVEMEAMTAVSAAALVIVDMCKAVDRGIQIDAIRLLEKRGGRSGEYRRRSISARKR